MELLRPDRELLAGSIGFLSLSAISHWVWGALYGVSWAESLASVMVVVVTAGLLLVLARRFWPSLERHPGYWLMHSIWFAVFVAFTWMCIAEVQEGKSIQDAALGALSGVFFGTPFVICSAITTAAVIAVILRVLRDRPRRVRRGIGWALVLVNVATGVALLVLAQPVKA